MSSKQTLLMPLLLVSLISPVRAQVMRSIAVTNAVNDRIAIVPIDEAHMPYATALFSHASTQAPGAFILKNLTDVQITAVVAQWAYSLSNGEVVKRGFNCDGYFASPTWAAVKAHDFSLITPEEGCTGSDRLLQTGNLRSNKLQSVPNKEEIAQVTLTLDSIIFENGDILGPDTLHYYREIWERYYGAKSILDECQSVKAGGGEIRAHLAKVLTDSPVARDRRTAWKKHYALLLERSPNLEGTLEQLRSLSTPPDFHHVGDQK